jgi:parallel beta-helix repeat protein
LTVSTIVIGLIATMLMAPAPSIGDVPAQIKYTVHDPILINDSADLASQAANESWPGDGSQASPYVIRNYSIDASSISGIIVFDTDAYFIIENCYLYLGNMGLGTFDGICLWRCSNGTLSNNSCTDDYYGIRLVSSCGITLYNNSCSANDMEGIFLSAGSNDNSLIGNNCSGNTEAGMRVEDSSGNTVTNNTCFYNYEGIDIIRSSENTVNNNTIGDSTGSDVAGIWLLQSGNNTISNNTCHSTYYGLALTGSSNNTISNNSCYLNQEDGIYFSSSDRNTLINNTCSNNTGAGMLLDSSTNNTVMNNTCVSNKYGISVSYSTNITLSQNTLVNNGIRLSGNLLKYVTLHTIGISNTVNGKPVYYYKNTTGGTVPAGAGQVILANCTGMIVEDQELNNASISIQMIFSANNSVLNNTCSNNSDSGIMLAYDSNNNTVDNNTCSNNNDYGIVTYCNMHNVISNNTCEDNYYGIYLESTEHNTILSNIAGDNYCGIGIYSNSNFNDIVSNFAYDSYDGIYVYMSTYNNILNNSAAWNQYGIHLDAWADLNNLSGNDCDNSSSIGIFLEMSSSNAISYNDIADNSGYGVALDSSSSSNTIWNNTFLDNNGGGIQALDDCIGNSWNVPGFPHGYGNYWDDLTSPDSDFDGIVDWSYNLTGAAGAKDWYPLTTKSIPPWIPEFSEVIVPIVGLMLIALIFDRARKKQ